ncbi:MarR family transcriptional regulator [Planctomonas sp. JC2975]|nr:MarR family transcriptional regulator [Planctomonas sp. JC2975]
MSDLSDARDLARMVVQLSERARADFAAAIAELDVPVLLARTVLLVDGRTPMREIASELGCDPSYVTSIADQLETRGLVVRTAGRDRRVKVLELTDAGAELKSAVSEAVEHHGPFAYQLDVTQKQTLRELLTILLAGNDDVTMTSCAIDHTAEGVTR